MLLAFAVLVLAIAAAVQGAPPVLACALGLAALAWPALRAPRLLPAFAVSAAVVAAWCIAKGRLTLAEQLHPALSGATIEARVRVAGAILDDDDALRFTAAPEAPTLPPRLRVSWPRPEAPRVRGGECWQLRLRLRGLVARHNPGAFDRHEWQRRRGVGANATVLSSRDNRPCDDAGPGLGARLRAHVRAAIDAAVPRADAGGVLRALTIGERTGLSPETRDTLARTGTAHLMAISGLHVGMVAALGYLLGRRVPRPRGAPAGLVASGFALLPAALYAALSGFALPARRALLMLALIALLQGLRRPIVAMRVVALALVVVVLSSPAFVVDASFVFSFTAVTALGAYRDAARQARDPPRWFVAAELQWLLGLAMLPATVAAFGFASALSLPANLLAVPWFSLFVVPLALVASALTILFGRMAEPLWQLAGALVGAALDGLGRMAAFDGGVIVSRLPGAGAALAATLLLGWAVLARGTPGRGMAACTLAAVLCAAPARPRPGCLQVTVLDVGHGTAIVARGHRAAFVYDTGPAWPGGRAAATTSLLPFLHRAAVGHIELGVLSHADIDHTGGAEVLAAAHPVRRWLAGPDVGLSGAVDCVAGQRWHSGGVAFEVVWPVRGALPGASDNDASCVLGISAGHARMLITGDIEAAAERELVALRAARANAVTVPHHGSATSSTADFVAGSGAGLALVSASPAGRWPLPHATVAARWRASGATLEQTAGHALGVRVCGGRGVRLQDPDPWAESGRALW